MVDNLAVSPCISSQVISNNTEWKKQAFKEYILYNIFLWNFNILTKSVKTYMDYSSVRNSDGKDNLVTVTGF